MQPTIVMLVSPMIFGEKLTGRKAVCALIAIAGMVLISGVADGGNAQTGDPKGIFLGLGAAVCYSVVVIMNKRIEGIDAYQKTIIQLLSAGIAMIPYLLATGGFDGIRLDAGSIGFLAVIGLVHTGIAYVLYFGSIDGMRAQSIAIFSYIDPVSALLFSALLLREPLSVSGVIGAVMIIGSAIASEAKAA
jgi:drug/metabolite transporter (DMT)-like permease